MKLSNVFAKLTFGKAKVLGTLGGLALAGAAMTMAAPAAKAQQFGVAVQFGGPRYVASAPPVYRTYGYGYGYYAPRYDHVGPEFWEHRRYEAWRAHEDWVRRHEGYGRPYRGW